MQKTQQTATSSTVRFRIQQSKRKTTSTPSAALSHDKTTKQTFNFLHQHQFNIQQVAVCKRCPYFRRLRVPCPAGKPNSVRRSVSRRSRPLVCLFRTRAPSCSCLRVSRWRRWGWGNAHGRLWTRLRRSDRRPPVLAWPVWWQRRRAAPRTWPIRCSVRRRRKRAPDSIRRKRRTPVRVCSRRGCRPCDRRGWNPNSARRIRRVCHPISPVMERPLGNQFNVNTIGIRKPKL